MDKDNFEIDKTPFIVTSLSILGILAISSVIAFIEAKIHPNCSGHQPFDYDKDDSSDDDRCDTYPTCSYVNNGDMVMTTDGYIVAYDGTQSIQYPL